MKVFDDAELVFDLKNIPATTNYEIVLRYEPQVSIVLQFVSAILEVNQNDVTYMQQLYNIDWKYTNIRIWNHYNIVFPIKYSTDIIHKFTLLNIFVWYNYNIVI